MDQMGSEKRRGKCQQEASPPFRPWLPRSAPATGCETGRGPWGKKLHLLAVGILGRQAIEDSHRNRGGSSPAGSGGRVEDTGGAKSGASGKCSSKRSES